MTNKLIEEVIINSFIAIEITLSGLLGSFPLWYASCSSSLMLKISIISIALLFAIVSLSRAAWRRWKKHKQYIVVCGHENCNNHKLGYISQETICEVLKNDR